MYLRFLVFASSIPSDDGPLRPTAALVSFTIRSPKCARNSAATVYLWRCTNSITGPVMRVNKVGFDLLKPCPPKCVATRRKTLSLLFRSSFLSILADSLLCCLKRQLLAGCCPKSRRQTGPRVLQRSPLQAWRSQVPCQSSAT